LARIQNYLRAQESIGSLLGPAFDSLVRGKPDDFIKLLTAFFKTRALRSLQSTNEATLQGIVELILDKPSSRVPELCLVIDGNKQKGNGRFGFVDVFIPGMTTTSGTRTDAKILELKYLTLEGLYKGMKKSWDRSPNYSDLENLDKLLGVESEESLLKREYM
jgi:hypothetical protein